MLWFYWNFFFIKKKAPLRGLFIILKYYNLECERYSKLISFVISCSMTNVIYLCIDNPRPNDPIVYDTPIALASWSVDPTVSTVFEP